MRRVLLMLAAWMIASAASAEVKPFTADSVKAIQQQWDGEPYLMVLWSIDCPPCHKELEMLGSLLKDDPDLAVTLVSTDQDMPEAQVRETLAQYKIESADNWRFADPVPARLRQAIDPSWYGELPRSYFVSSNGERKGRSGLLSEDAIRNWLQ
ncbi:Thiol-disulfide isomerase and thioredoxins [Hahella chejuensis KCTC 2396]|uniref:Thiol-disulfide isomerase and thioredoxins n=1 Tax=Hahella chejuensis (strain KCTC 2396) TaxID=349521 RepID=Q2SGB1_HAHCH|nr:thiol-disulfide isomerase-like protein [Hahella chejuensis]ABC30313.1 Thiol-disulfide isomerase and thioredoxins [Hahella chejuensis KCTC 2396]